MGDRGGAQALSTYGPAGRPPITGIGHAFPGPGWPWRLDLVLGAPLGCLDGSANSPKATALGPVASWIPDRRLRWMLLAPLYI